MPQHALNAPLPSPKIRLHSVRTRRTNPAPGTPGDGRRITEVLAL